MNELSLSSSFLAFISAIFTKENVSSTSVYEKVPKKQVDQPWVNIIYNIIDAITYGPLAAKTFYISTLSSYANSQWSRFNDGHEERIGHHSPSRGCCVWTLSYRGDDKMIWEMIKKIEIKLCDWSSYAVSLSVDQSQNSSTNHKAFLTFFVLSVSSVIS